MPAAPIPSGPLDSQSPFSGKHLILGAMVVLLVGMVWMQIKRTQEGPAVQAAAVPKKKKPRAAKAGSTLPGLDSARAAAGPRDSAGAADSASRAASRNASVTAGEEAPAAGTGEDEDMEAWSYARLRWEKPDSKELAERVNRLGDGFDGRPVGKFHTVQGRFAFLRVSTLVNPSPDRRMDRIPESAVTEYLPEWYQRGFTIHGRGPFHRFSPRLFRLRNLPGWKPDTTEEGLSRPVKYLVQAYVEEEGGLLLYPDATDREGDNGFREPEEFKSETGGSPFSAAYFRTLTRGKVDAIRTFDFPDKGFGLVEVLAKRKAPAGMAAAAGMAADSLRLRSGAYLFLVKPAERKIAFLTHDFDGRFCPEDKKIRFRGTMDVDGDDNSELLLGPRPTFLIHEDLEGLKYHFEDGYKCI